MEFAEVVRKECLLASCYLEVAGRLATAERLALSRGDVPLNAAESRFSVRDAAILSVIARGRCPFSIDEDQHLSALTERLRDNSGRIVWSAVVGYMHEIFSERKRTTAVYQQRLYKLCRQQ